MVERQTSNPDSFDELSVQVSVMAVVEVAAAVAPLGVAGGGGAGVVAQTVAENPDGGALPPPIARTS